MNICFITVFHKTDLFESISSKLNNNHEVFWITTSSYYKKKLLNKGFCENNILSLDRQESKSYIISNEDINYAKNVEVTNGITINSIYFMDRIISKWHKDEAERYFYYVINKIKRFIKNNNIKVVTGETTAAHEILCSLICKYEKSFYVQPFTIRYPYDHFCFFEGVDHSKVLPIFNDSLNLEVENIYDKVIKNKEKPKYWYINNKISGYDFKFLIKSVKKILESLKYSKSDATVKSLKYHIMYEKKYFKYINSKMILFSKIFEQPNLKDKFILFTLHKQPEASIDVLGVKYNNQIEVIKRLIKNLPIDVFLYVKEHSNALGERNIKILKEIKKLPNVKLIDPYYDTNNLIMNSIATISISGTVSFEAALMGKKTITLANMFFSKLSTARYAKDEEECLKFVELKLNHNLESDKKYLFNNILKFSFKGIISDAMNDPSCMEDKNVSNIEFAYNKLLEWISLQLEEVNSEDFNYL